MKILFLASANNSSGDVPILVRVQGDLLTKHLRVLVNYYGISGKGLFGYLSHLIALRKEILKTNVDIVHAHFSFAGVLAMLTMVNKPIVVSLLGTDVFDKKSFWKRFALSLVKLRASLIVVKSDAMKKELCSSKAIVLANGVDVDKFNILDKAECRKKLGWQEGVIHVLFGADNSRPEKNFHLFKSAIDLLQVDIVVHTLKNVNHDDIPLWINASNIVALSSFWEGSPNIIKESMACNAMIICTDVGDVNDLFYSLEGVKVAKHDVSDYHSKLQELLTMQNNGVFYSGGRNSILDLELDSVSVSKRLLGFYKSLNETIQC